MEITYYVKCDETRRSSKNLVESCIPQDQTGGITMPTGQNPQDSQDQTGQQDPQDPTDPQD